MTSETESLLSRILYLYVMCEAIYDTHKAGLVARSDSESNRCTEEAEYKDTLEKHLGQGCTMYKPILFAKD